jgi:hypothetical protein
VLPCTSCLSRVAGVGAARRTRSATRSRRSATACPGIVDDANATLADLQDWLDDNGIDVEIAKQGETALRRSATA